MMRHNEARLIGRARFDIPFRISLDQTTDAI
jgi:hypothetical protein